MKKIFENEQFVLSLTEHDYDFVAIMETKTNEPLTFFFSEMLIPADSDDEKDMDWDDAMIDEDETELELVCNDTMTDEEIDDAMFRCSATSYFQTRDDRSTGFLADCKERGQLLAIVKEYCPEKLDEVKKSIY